MKRILIGELLKEYGYINDEQLQTALNAQKENKSKRLGELLVELGFVTEEQTLRALSEKLGQPMINLKTVPVDIQAVAMIPQELAEKYSAVAVNFDTNALLVVTSDPMNFYGLEDIRLVTGMDLTIGLAVSGDIKDFIDYNYSEIKANQAAEIANRDSFQFQIVDEDIFDSEEDDSPVVKLLNSLLIKGFTSNVSDIHIEPFENETLVRMRIDGMLVESMKLQKNIHSALVVRTKILANLDISEKEYLKMDILL